MIAVFIISSVLMVIFCKVKKIQRKVIGLLKNKKTQEQMRILYCEKEAERQYYVYLEKKIKKILLMIMLGSVLAYGSRLMAELNPVVDSGNYVKRNGYGMGKKAVSIFVSSESLPQKEKLQISISDRKYTSEEIGNMAGEVTEQIYKQIFNEDESFDRVTTHLNLMNSIEGYPFKITWRSEKPTILNRKGTVDTGRLKDLLKETGDDNMPVKLTAHISYEDYEEDIEMMVNLMVEESSYEESFMEMLREEIEQADEESRESDSMELPSMVAGNRLEYEGDEKKVSLLILAITVTAAATIFFAGDDELSRQVRIRNEQMEDDYPRIVNQYALYYCAGMNTQSVWQEICSDYRRRIRSDKDRRYAYEEMLRTEAAMSDGAGESAAYSEFGKNCGIRRYRRFVSLLQQALSKGKEQMAEDLRKEVEEASSEKIKTAMIRGEEAGTKLLIPMFMMLGIVLIIVVVPAFMNFNVN